MYITVDKESICFSFYILKKKTNRHCKLLSHNKIVTGMTKKIIHHTLLKT